MAQPLPRFDPNLQREDAAKVDKLVEQAEIASAITGLTAAGDVRRLRGIPVVTRGVRGAAPRTRPGDGLN